MEEKREFKSTISLQEYISKLGTDGEFFIPKYQRGYIWGQHNKLLSDDNNNDSASFLIDTILNGFNSQKDIFLQGITVTTGSRLQDLVIVDGQQRTTFFYLLLKYLGFKGYIKIHYDVRGASNSFLENLDVKDCYENEKEPYQDIFFFKKTLRTFHDKIGCDSWKDSKAELLKYVLSHIRFLYITIPPEKATIVFTMMNGNKAVMRQEELIKAELLRSSTVTLKNGYIGEAENNSIRSRYAREWDKWLYWWNDENVKSFFKTDLQLGWLLPLTINRVDVSFEDFKGKCLSNNSIREAKDVFRSLRLLQQSFEDIYNNPITYNYIGAILCIRNKEQRFNFLKWYLNIYKDFGHKVSIKELRRYFDWAFINVSHRGIINKNHDEYLTKRADFLERLSDDSLYLNNYEVGAMWLLRSNILEDCTQELGRGRKFDFNIWNQRSLEHIYPKSKVGHIQNNVKCDWQDNPLTTEEVKDITLWRDDIVYTDSENSQLYRASEHSIGNLVLLYKSDNSKFSNADFEQKKNIYFDITDDSGFQSRHLLHTVSVFASSRWGGNEIAMHKKNELARFEKDYTEDYE